MADRGYKAFPVSSHITNDRWVEHCQRLHKERLANITSRIDQCEPESCKVAPKRQQQEQRQTVIDQENKLLLDKLIKIKSTPTPTESTFKPWLGRATFQFKGGGAVYYDPTKNYRCVDHRNATMGLSPISIHHPLHSSKVGAPSYAAMQKQMQVAEDNSKLLKAIEDCRPLHNTESLERDYLQSTEYRARSSRFRGPSSAFYAGPPGSSPRTAWSPPRSSGSSSAGGGSVAGRRPASANPYLRSGAGSGGMAGGSRPSSSRPMLSSSTAPPAGREHGRPSTAPVSRPSASASATLASMTAAPPASAFSQQARTEYRPRSGNRPSATSRPSGSGPKHDKAAPPADKDKDYGWGKDPNEPALVVPVSLYDADDAVIHEGDEEGEDEEVNLLLETEEVDDDEGHSRPRTHRPAASIASSKGAGKVPGIEQSKTLAALSDVSNPGFRPSSARASMVYVFSESTATPSVRGRRPSSSTSLRAGGAGAGAGPPTLPSTSRPQSSRSSVTVGADDKEPLPPNIKSDTQSRLAALSQSDSRLSSGVKRTTPNFVFQEPVSSPKTGGERTEGSVSSSKRGEEVPTLAKESASSALARESASSATSTEAPPSPSRTETLSVKSAGKEERIEVEEEELEEEEAYDEEGFVDQEEKEDAKSNAKEEVEEEEEEETKTKSKARLFLRRTMAQVAFSDQK